MLHRIAALLADDEGATLVEYGLLLALIAVVAIGVITTLGQNLVTMFNTVANDI